LVQIQPPQPHSILRLILKSVSPPKGPLLGNRGGPFSFQHQKARAEKTMSERKRGTVKWFNITKGYGFIEVGATENDVFVHISACEKAGIDALKEGDEIEFDLEPGRNGKTQAVNIKVLT
jgi:cold shock protein